MTKKYRHIWRQKRSLIDVESHLRQYTEQRDILGSTHNHSFLYAREGIAEEFHRDFDNRQWIESGKNFLTKSFVEKFLEEGKVLRESFALFLSELNNNNLTYISDEKLIALFTRAYQFHSRFRGFFKATRGEFLFLAEKKLRGLLIQKLPNEQEAQKVFETLTTPSDLDEVNREFIDWVDLSGKKDIKKNLQQHISKYPWLVAHTYKIDEIMRVMLEKYASDHKEIERLKKEVDQLQEDKIILSQKQQQLRKDFQEEKINYLAWLFQQISLERVRLKGGWAGSDFLYLPLYQEISRRTKIPLKELYSFYRIEEVIQAIQGHRPILSPAELEERKQAYVLLLQEGKLQFFSGAEAETIIAQELKHLWKKDSSEISGRVASSGVARGKVRVVIPGDLFMLSQSLHEFQEGEILVTTMTQPNMVPLMKKAVAFITDEGGMTSHAAIIAREFNIPCIVGTEIATKVLKDGDLVEVDAEKGIVKKLK